MTRKIPSKPKQLGLFDAQHGAVDDRSWCERYWPFYTIGPRPREPSASAIVQWAETFQDLRKGPRTVFLSLAELAGATPIYRSDLRALARHNAMSRNALKRHLERLLDAGLVMIRPWSEPRSSVILGYEFCLMIDPEDRDAALAEGYSADRLSNGSASGGVE